MTDETTILVTILGQTDAAYRPIRSWGGRLGATAWQARRQYGVHGVPWHPGRPDPAGRKAVERVTGKLIEAKAIVAVATEGRIRWVKLTTEGEILARGLVGAPNLDEAHGTLRRLAGWGPDVLVSEMVLLRGRPNSVYRGTREEGRELGILQGAMLPNLVHDFAISRTDCEGRSYYAVTATGRAWASRPFPDLSGELPEFDEEAMRLYFTIVEETLQRLASAPPQNSEVGELPVPVSGGNFRDLFGQPARPRRRRSTR